MNTRPAIGEWEQRFLLELRSRDIDGSRIGELLAEVQSHCADTGETPEQAFGDPVAYAASRSDAPRTPIWRTALQSAAGIAGVLGFLAAVDGLATDGRAEPAAGSIAFIAVAAVGIPLLLNSFTRGGASRAWQAFAWILLVTGLSVAAVWRAPVASIPAWPLLAGCLALLAAAFIPGIRSEGVIDPRTGEDPLVTRGQARVLTWGPVALLAVSGAAVWVLARTT